MSTLVNKLYDDKFEIIIPYFNSEERVRLVIYDNKEKRFSLLIEVEAGSTYIGRFSDLSAHKDFKYKIQVIRNGKWVDEIKYSRLMSEITSHDGLKYIFFPAKNSRKLIVVFQAINRNPGYNYVGTLSSVNAHRLYIKDDYGSDVATRSSYYLGGNRSFEIHNKVIELIATISEALDVRSEDIIFAGSSKGGFSSIYTALSMECGTVIAGGPQILLGDFLNSKNPESVNPPIMQYLAGDITDESVIWLNNLILDKVSACKGKINFHIHVGEGEPHYRKHVLPFIDMVKDNPLLKVDLDLADYSSHSELAKYFPEYLRKIAKEITSEEE